jgi:hypothetical protein
MPSCCSRATPDLAPRGERLVILLPGGKSSQAADIREARQW